MLVLFPWPGWSGFAEILALKCQVKPLCWRNVNLSDRYVHIRSSWKLRGPEAKPVGGVFIRIILRENAFFSSPLCWRTFFSTLFFQFTPTWLRMYQMLPTYESRIFHFSAVRAPPAFLFYVPRQQPSRDKQSLIDFHVVPISICLVKL